MSLLEEIIRGIAAPFSFGTSEVIGRKGGFLGSIGKPITGGIEGGIPGFFTGGVPGAVMGAGTGMGLSASGATDPYTLKGGLINAGSGVGAGGLGNLGSSLFAGGSASSGMVPYMPTSTPDMGLAGSTLGPGGMSSPLNPMSGVLPESGGPMAQYFSTLKRLNQLRSLSKFQRPSLEQQQQNSKMEALQRMRNIYTMFPDLAPGGTSATPYLGGSSYAA